MASYLKVIWHHELLDEPVELFSEIEVYRDGHRDCADRSRSKGTSLLAETKMPGIAEIAVQPEFSPAAIDAAEFETE